LPKEHDVEPVLFGSLGIRRHDFYLITAVQFLFELYILAVYYKGIKGETGLDEWLTSVREALENADNDSLKVMDADVSGSADTYPLR